jgi:hypothetical protein
MLVSSYAAHDCQIKSNLFKQSRNTEIVLYTTEPKGDIVIEMSGKYDFKVTCDLIEMMDAESKVYVNWSYNVNELKGSCEKYNLNHDLVKVLLRRLCSSMGTIATGFTEATITSTSGECT